MVFKALYVEDDPGSRNVFKMAQRMNPGFIEATIFEDSEDFENKLLSLNPPPDIILLDIHVKPHTGFEMLDMIRHHAEFDNTPVVAMTASVMHEEIEVLRTAGFHGVLSKPIDLDAFPDLIKRIMSGEAVWHIW